MGRNDNLRGGAGLTKTPAAGTMFFVVKTTTPPVDCGADLELSSMAAS
jgi:hypothetical protein